MTERMVITVTVVDEVEVAARQCAQVDRAVRRYHHQLRTGEFTNWAELAQAAIEARDAREAS